MIFFKKLSPFPFLPNDTRGNKKALGAVINALITQKLPKFKKQFFKNYSILYFN